MRTGWGLLGQHTAPRGTQPFPVLPRVKEGQDSRSPRSWRLLLTWQGEVGLLLPATSPPSPSQRCTHLLLHLQVGV